jgi:hypothetical protein
MKSHELRPVVMQFWLYCSIIEGGAKVYDVTKYMEDHPGGPEILVEHAGIRFQLHKSQPTI